MRTGFVVSFGGQMQDALLNETIFRNPAQARIVFTVRAADCNSERPHSASHCLTTADYARTPTTAIVRLCSNMP